MIAKFVNLDCIILKDMNEEEKILMKNLLEKLSIRVLSVTTNSEGIKEVSLTKGV